VRSPFPVAQPVPACAGNRTLFFVVATLCLLAVSGRAEADYLRVIKPLLQRHCYACHGALKQEGELRLDTAAALLKGGESGPAVRPGNPSRSLLLERVSSTDPEEHMPPKHEGENLSASQIALLTSWIAAGAPAPAGEEPEADPRDHWAFRPRVRPPVPAGDSRWTRTPVDAFISAQHLQAGLQPVAEAPRDILLRRLFLDLVGVPPSAEEAAVAHAAEAGVWYEQTVERLLADPRHGERWGRHWMDIWRYSDWWGLGAQLRNSQRHMWHWRDWIVEALNADTPYDEMVRLMLAADEIAPDDPGKLRATGFLARNWFLFNRNTWMEETVEHVGKAFLGLTLNCAKCHDHKYDPVTQQDYYRMRAFFEPYQVRLDVVPGQVDLEKDGIPRVFDGLPAPPTYRFVRGEEANPDKSVSLQPGVPALLAFTQPRIQPVPLPAVSSQPERQPWVLDAHMQNSLSSLRAAGETLQKLSEQLEDGRLPTKQDAGEWAAVAAELQVAGMAVALRQAEHESVELRANAMRAGWKEDLETGRLAQGALRAERYATVARQRHAMAQAQLLLLKATADKKDTAEKALKTADEALEKAKKQADAPVAAGSSYTRLYGAKWTATRFLNSAKDDPEVHFSGESTGRRRSLAHWLTDPRNPLVARVAANHLWTRHMGVPLAAGVFEFGRKGAPPSHPALLDWLASELVEGGWSMKRLHRLIVNSATYRMSSSQMDAGANLQKDPDNLHLWRRAPLRLEAEAVRDSLLALSRQLDPQRGGPPVAPGQQAASKRRSLYFYHSNNERNLFLTTFDQAAVKECYRREQSIVPQQALALCNSGLVLEAAERIAGFLSEGNLSSAPAVQPDEAFVRKAYTYILGGSAVEAEVDACLRALAAWRASADPRAPTAGQAARAHLVWALLNHNDFVTLR
jgi:mono/diheme cytochrome c family protein